MTKKNPVLEDPNYWRYQKFVEYLAHLIQDNPLVTSSKEMLIGAVAHVAKKSYDLGIREGTNRVKNNFEVVLIDIGKNVCIKTRGVLN